MTKSSTRLRAAGAASAVGALIASALMVAPSAHAATTLSVKNADVRPNATTYAGWHQGYANNPAGAKVTAKGLELSGGPSQVINGYVDNDSTIGTNKNFDLAAKITGADFTASEGVANLQVPLFGENVVPSASGSKFATLRSATDEGSRIKLTDEWESSRAIGTIPANTPTPLKTILAALGNYKVVAFGVQADNNAVVTDITWDGTTYVFKEPVPVVAKQASKVDIYRVAPKSGKITTNNTVKVYASVTIGGKAAPAGTVVTGFAKGKKVATGKVNSQGKVKLTLRKLPKGKSTLKAQLSSTGTVTGSTDSVAVKVVKKK